MISSEINPTIAHEKHVIGLRIKAREKVRKGRIVSALNNLALAQKIADRRGLKKRAKQIVRDIDQLDKEFIGRDISTL